MTIDVVNGWNHMLVIESVLVRLCDADTMYEGANLVAILYPKTNLSLPE